jgi:DNA-binding FrmR family transcriptional regulator
MPRKQDNIVQRLRRIEGQVRGLQKMVEEGRPCEDVLTQLLAVQAALDKVATKLVGEHVAECLQKLEPKEATENIGKAIELISRMR